MTSAEFKTCSKCGEAKPAKEFYVGKAQCKGCISEQRRQRRAENPEANRERCRNYYQRNSEQLRVKVRAYDAANKDVIRERKREYAQDNAESIREYKREHYLANADRLNERGREYNRTNPHIAWASHFRSRTPHENPVVEDFKKGDVVARYGDKCFYCATGGFEELDHYVAVSLGGHHTLENVRPSCLPCNRTKNATHPSRLAAPPGPEV